jgi:hypothetical protein
MRGMGKRLTGRHVNAIHRGERVCDLVHSEHAFDSLGSDSPLFNNKSLRQASG